MEYLGHLYQNSEQFTLSVDLYSQSEFQSTQGEQTVLSCNYIAIDSTNKSTNNLKVKTYQGSNKRTQARMLDGSLVLLLELEYSAVYPEEESINWSEDILIFPTESTLVEQPIDDIELRVYTAYKRVAQKIHPVSGTFPEEARVHRKFPHNPLDTLPPLPTNPPEFTPTQRLTQERMDSLEINKEGFLTKEEEKLFKHILVLNERTLPFEEKDRGIFNKEYFSDYIMPTIPHTPWEYKNIPIPPGIRDKVLELLKSKIEAGVYEPSQSSYRCRWFCVAKKNGSLRIVHDLQPLNQVSIRDAGLLPIVDDFVESYAGY